MATKIPNDYIECDCGEHSHYVCVTHSEEEDWPCWLELGEIVVPSKLRWFGRHSRLGFVWNLLRGQTFMFHGVALTEETRDRLLEALVCGHKDMTADRFTSEFYTPSPEPELTRFSRVALFVKHPLQRRINR